MWPEWQKIETAPKDGTRILLCGPYETCLGRWTEIGYWWSGNRWMGESAAAHLNPTHWMPLPPPPVERGEYESNVLSPSEPLPPSSDVGGLVERLRDLESLEADDELRIEAAAMLQAQAAEIERWAAQTNKELDCNELLRAKIAALTEKVERYREALEDAVEGFTENCTFSFVVRARALLQE